jgi:outer membrane usher protein FimD/PapC
MAARDMNDTGVIVSANGGGSGQKFDVLIDEAIRGTVNDGGQLVVFLQPYRAYDIRVRPRDSQISEFDAAPRTITLYPGNVARLDWKVTPLFILFGRAVEVDGRPLADVGVSGSHGVSRTDKDGYFQIETNRNDRLRISRKDASVCKIVVATSDTKGFVSAGDQVCQ